MRDRTDALKGLHVSPEPGSATVVGVDVPGGTQSGVRDKLRRAWGHGSPPPPTGAKENGSREGAPALRGLLLGTAFLVA